MKYLVTVNGKNYEVEVEEGAAVVLSETVAAAPVPVAAPVAAPVPAAAPAPVAAAAGEAVKAPMPGTILAVKVKVGEAVKSGQVVVILEAMKMENEICAPRDGVVAQVVTPNGTSVVTDDAMIILS